MINPHNISYIYFFANLQKLYITSGMVMQCSKKILQKIPCYMRLTFRNHLILPVAILLLSAVCFSFAGILRVPLGYLIDYVTIRFIGGIFN